MPLSLLHLSAWTCILILQSLPQADARVPDRLAKHLPRRVWQEKRQLCQEDGVWSAISSRDDYATFCSVWNNIPNATSTTYYTPYTTLTNVFTTQTVTEFKANRLYATTTVTATTDLFVPKQKRGPAPAARTIVPRADQLQLVEQLADEFMASSATPTVLGGDQADAITSISSACSCLGSPLFTVTETQTEPTFTREIAAYTITTYSINSTTTVRTFTTTALVNNTVHTGTASVVSGISLSGTSTTTLYSTVVVSPVPTSPVNGRQALGFGFTCPDANGSQQTVIFGAEIYTYSIFCSSSFATETAFTSASAASYADCLSFCSEANELAGAPFCKGATFNGSTCSLYSTASYSDLANATGIDSAILARVDADDSLQFANRTVGSSASASIATGLTAFQALITPPPNVTSLGGTTTSCFTLTTHITSPFEGISSTYSCTTSSSWYEYWALTKTLVYYSQEVIEKAGRSGSGQAQAQGGGAAAQEQGSGAGSGGAGNGGAGSGSAGAWTSTYTVTGSNYTSVYVTTYAASGAGGNGAGGEGVHGGSATATSGELAGSGGSGNSGGGAAPFTSTVTTIANGSTVTFVTTGVSSGAAGNGSGGGGVSAFPAANGTTITGAYTSVSMESGQASGAGGSGSGGGGASPLYNTTAWYGPNATIIRSTSTVVVVLSSGLSSAAGTGTGGGGFSPYPNSTSSTTPGASETVLLDSTILSNATTGVLGTLAENSGAGTHTASGGISLYPASHGTDGRSGSQTPPGPTGSFPSHWNYTSPPGYGHASPSSPGSGWNVSSPASPDTGVLGMPLPTWSPSGMRGSRSGSEDLSSSAPSSGFPIPISNGSSAYNWTSLTLTAATTDSTEVVYDSWLGELHPGPSSYPPHNYNGSWSPSHSRGPRIGSAGPSSGLPHRSNSSFTASRTQGPRSGTAARSSKTSAKSSKRPTLASYCATSNISTITVTETSYTGCPGVCITQSVAPFGHGYGSYGGGGYGGAHVDTMIASSGASFSSSLDPSPSSSSSTLRSDSELQRPGETAAPAQILGSCSNIGNQIYNGEFEITTQSSPDGPLEPSGWGFASASVQMFLTDKTTASNDQVTPGGTHVAQFVTYAKSAAGKLIQPLTLCPNSTYEFSGNVRQSRPAAVCNVVFMVGGVTVGAITPTTDWSDLLGSTNRYTTGDASGVDFSAAVSCSGDVSEQSPGTVDFDDLSVVVVV